MPHKTTNTIATQSPNQPIISGTTPLDVVKQLVFILRTFNSKQVDTTWRQFMASKDTNKKSSPTKALGLNLLQEPSSCIAIILPYALTVLAYRATLRGLALGTVTTTYARTSLD